MNKPDYQWILLSSVKKVDDKTIIGEFAEFLRVAKAFSHVFLIEINGCGETPTACFSRPYPHHPYPCQTPGPGPQPNSPNLANMVWRCVPREATGGLSTCVVSSLALPTLRLRSPLTRHWTYTVSTWCQIHGHPGPSA